MTRELALQRINEILAEEHGNPITYDDTLISSGIDSFGLTMVLLGVDVYTREEFTSINFAEVTANDVIERMLNGNK
jgi:aryl carrier-like protein